MTFSHLDHLRADSARFLEALRHATPQTRVPTCPDWTADDLLWHLGGEVQWFWASIIEQDLRTDQQIADLVELDRPLDREGLLAVFTQQSARLARVAAAADPADPRWMWVADERQHNVGYIVRRQAHEALIHRIDAELTAGLDRAPIDAELAADGIDEAVRLMHGNQPGWGTFAPTGQVVRLAATDTGDAWLVQLGRFTGTAGDGKPVDVPSWGALPTDDGRDVDATITAMAADLDLWLWRRPGTQQPVLAGDSDAIAAAASIVGTGVD